MPLELSPDDKVGLIAGGGNLPEEVIKSCLSIGQKLFVIYMQGAGEEPASLSSIPHAKLHIGAVGKAIRTLKSEGVKHIVMAGGIKRPKLSALKPDAGGIKLLARISAAKFSGDNALLLTVITFFENEGFTVIGVDKLLKQVLMPHGQL